MKLTNYALEQCMHSLEPALKCKGKLGFIAAKNYRKISDELTEYFDKKNSLIIEYGEQDEDGKWFVDTKSERSLQFLDELNEIGNINCAVDIYTVVVADILDHLTGEEMNAISWMVSDWDDETVSLEYESEGR